MPVHDTFMLYIYHSRTLSGRQWRARLAHLAGESRCASMTQRHSWPTSGPS